MTELTYYQRISALGKEAIRRRKAAGESMHRVPLGYRTAVAEGRRILERHPKKYRLVQEAKRLWADGNSLRAICRIMEEKGLRSHRGKLIKPSSMYWIVRHS